jgi:hypothetical protein
MRPQRSREIDVEELFANTTRRLEVIASGGRGLNRARIGPQLHDQEPMRRWRRSDLFTKSVQSVTRSSRLGIDKLNRLCARANYRGELISKPELPDRANRSKKSQENTLAEIRVVAPSPI